MIDRGFFIIMIEYKTTGRANINFYNCDNLKFMKSKPDNFYKLAIVDPPYFDGPNKLGYYRNGRTSKTGVKSNSYSGSIKEWKIPDEKYFKELLRVSKHQIVWGINYFNIVNLGTGRIVWNKCNQQSTFSDCEIAFSSKIKHVKIFNYMWNGMMQGKSITEGHLMQGNKKLNEKRIHPTQKPVKLYKWLLSNFAKQGDNIIDTHGGSASIAIACWDLGFDLDLCELDEDYFNDSWSRFKTHSKQTQLF